MGFNKQARKEATAEDRLAVQEVLRVTKKQEEATDKYNADSPTRNANMIGLRDAAVGRLEGFKKGKDVAGLYPELNTAFNQIADQILNTTRFASKLGTTNSGDASYSNKLNSLNTRALAVGAGRNISENVGQLQNQDRGFVVESDDYLNQDRRVGLGLGQDNISNFSNYKSVTAQRREAEELQAQRSWSNMMGLISAGTGFATGFGGITSLFKKSGNTATSV